MSDNIPQNSGLQIFSYENHEVRTVFIDDVPWWIAKDVCQILGIQNIRQNLAKLDDDEKGVYNAYTPGGHQDLIIINEPGLYSLVLTSRKPEAKQFKRWITHEVLPSIRKTGSYTAPANSPQIKLFPLQEVMHNQALKNWNLVPAGHFGVLTEMYAVMVVLTGKGYMLPERSKPDGSVGKIWKKYAKEHYGIDPTGMYNYLDEKDRAYPSFTYSLEHVRAFRDFLQDVYFIEYYPKYKDATIKRQSKKNQQIERQNKNRSQIEGK